MIPRLVKRSLRIKPIVPTCGTATSSRAPADSLTHSPLDKAEVVVAAATFKASVLDVDVVAVVVVAAIKVAAVTKDMANADTTVGAKVHTTKETKDPTTKATRALQPRRWGLVQKMPYPPSV